LDAAIHLNGLAGFDFDFFDDSGAYAGLPLMPRGALLKHALHLV
jgi:hypothetical protein